MKIKNPSFQNEFKFASIQGKEWDFIRQVNIGDKIVYHYGNSIKESIVKTITTRGCNVSTPYGDRFYKWHHVKEIIKEDN